MLRTAAPMKGEYKVTGIVNWEVQEGPSSYFIFPSCAPDMQASGKGQRPHSRYSKEPGAGAEAALPGKRQIPGGEGPHLANKTEGAKSATRPTFECKHI